jgi:site-specific DNA recombinase
MSPKKIAKPLDIYVRVSDVRGRAGDSFISPDEQESRCRAAIASRGLEVGEVFSELDVSGKSMERPELTKARKRIEDGRSGGIVVARIDRFGRTVARALDAIEEIDQAGGVVITAEGDFDTSTATGELVLNMMLTLAQFELRRIRENWTTAQRRAVERGVHISRHVPPGYEKRKDGTFVPHATHGKTINRAYRMAVDGESPSTIARYLNKRELPSGNGPTVWKASRIKRLLANPVYKGQARYGDIVNNAAHTPLVEEATWLLAQRKTANSPTPVKESSVYLLSGFCRCASCRHAMRSQAARGDTIGTYRCATETASGKCPHPTSVSMNKLDDYVYAEWIDRVWDKYTKLQPKPDNSAEALEDLEEAKQALAELQAAEQELDPLAYARAETKILARIEEAQGLVSTTSARVDDVFQQWLADGGPEKARAEVQAVMRGEARGLDNPTPEGTALMRSAMARDIVCVFVRPAASRSNKLPVSDRVHIVWRDSEEADALELPRRGEVFTPRPYVFPDESGKVVPLAS